MIELITVKEYSTREKISETATRKRLAKGLVQATQLDEITYIIYKNNIEQTIKDLKNSLKLKNSIINKLKVENNYLKEQDNKIKELEQELKEYVIRERGLYEKVIGQLDKMMLPLKV